MLPLRYSVNGKKGKIVTLSNDMLKKVTSKGRDV